MPPSEMPPSEKLMPGQDNSVCATGTSKAEMIGGF
jgi:hypothetical protein